MTGSYSSDVKTAVSIPDPIFEAADRLARRRKVSRSRRYATAPAMLLESERSADVTTRLDAIYADVDSSFDEALGRAQAAALREDW
jgi:hypothetical protein